MKTFSEYLSEEFLVENRIDFLLKKYDMKIKQKLQHHLIDNGNWMTTPGADKSLEIINGLARDADPTPNKMYIEWLIIQWLTQPRVEEDLARIRTDLALYTRVKQRLPGEYRDIFKFKDYHHLSNILVPYEETKSQGDVKREEYDQMMKETTLFHRSSAGMILVPLTQKSAMFWGRGTKWCTAADFNNMFAHYNKRGPLYIFITHDGRKYQYQVETNQFMDDRDQEAFVSFVEKYPKLFKIFLDLYPKKKEIINSKTELNKIKHWFTLRPVDTASAYRSDIEVDRILFPGGLYTLALNHINKILDVENHSKLLKYYLPESNNAIFTALIKDFELQIKNAPKDSLVMADNHFTLYFLQKNNVDINMLPRYSNHLSKAYHHVNNSFSGKRAHDLGLNVSEHTASVGKLIGKIIGAMSFKDR